MGLGITWSERAVSLEMTREQIEQAPEYDPDRIVDRPFEEQLYGHYRRPGYW
jgi:stress response protein YsnF